MPPASPFSRSPRASGRPAVAPAEDRQHPSDHRAALAEPRPELGDRREPPLLLGGDRQRRRYWQVPLAGRGADRDSRDSAPLRADPGLRPPQSSLLMGGGARCPAPRPPRRCEPRGRRPTPGSRDGADVDRPQGRLAPLRARRRLAGRTRARARLRPGRAPSRARPHRRQRLPSPARDGEHARCPWRGRRTAGACASRRRARPVTRPRRGPGRPRSPASRRARSGRGRGASGREAAGSSSWRAASGMGALWPPGTTCTRCGRRPGGRGRGRGRPASPRAPSASGRRARRMAAPLLALGELPRGELVRVAPGSAMPLPFAGGVSAHYAEPRRTVAGWPGFRHPDAELWKSRPDGTERCRAHGGRHGRVPAPLVAGRPQPRLPRAGEAANRPPASRGSRRTAGRGGAGQAAPPGRRATGIRAGSREASTSSSRASRTGCSRSNASAPAACRRRRGRNARLPEVRATGSHPRVGPSGAGP